MCKNTQPGQFNWDHIRAFLEVARTGKLVAAASKLKTDHTTIARRISTLESSLKVKLFDRSPRGYALTRNGDELVSIAEQMELLTIQASDTIGGKDLKVSGNVRVAAPEGFGSYFLASELGGLNDLYPELSVKLVASPNLVSLSKREADLAIVLSRPTGGRLVAKKLVDFELGLFASKHYLAGTSEIRRTDDLKSHRFIGYIDDLLYAPELDYAQDIHTGVEPIFESNNLVAQVSAALNGTGLCILPSFIALRYDQLSAVLPSEVRLEREFWMVSHADMKGVNRIDIAKKYISQRIAENKAIFRLPRP